MREADEERDREVRDVAAHLDRRGRDRPEDDRHQVLSADLIERLGEGVLGVCNQSR